MKQVILSIFFLSVFVTASFSQTNSVDLKDGNGNPVSQHNSVGNAYNSIPGSISQAYIIEITSIYTGVNESFPITLTNRVGSSAANTITIRPAAGNTGAIIVGNSISGLMILNDADYVIIDGRPGGVGSVPDMKLQNNATSGTNANTIQFINGSSNNIVRFVHAISATQGSAGPRTIVFESSTSGIGNNDNLIHDCKVEGGRSGIGFAGSATAININNKIQRCEIYHFGYAGIWLLSNSQKILIEDCIIRTSQSTQTLNTGINIGASIGDTIIIRNNKIYDIQSTSTGTANAIRGIWHQTNVAAGSVWYIYNNFIALPLNNNNAQTIVGIDISAGTSTFNSNLYYNSIRIGGTHSSGTVGNVVSAGIRSANSGIILSMKNNICINNRTGGTSGVVHTGFALTNTAITRDIDYNCYFADGTNSFNAYWEATGYSDISTYRGVAAPDEQNSTFHNVSFVSATDLHLAGSSIGDAELKGTPIAGITTDIDGDIRNAIAPYKGADEGDIPLSITQNANMPVDFELRQNYPNPFNPKTTINFSIPVNGVVELVVYDITGKEVAGLFKGELQAGSYTINFDASGLTSGVYFYKLTTGNRSDVKQMLLLK